RRRCPGRRRLLSARLEPIDLRHAQPERPHASGHHHHLTGRRRPRSMSAARSQGHKMKTIRLAYASLFGATAFMAAWSVPAFAQGSPPSTCQTVEDSNSVTVTLIGGPGCQGDTDIGVAISGPDYF